MPWNKKSSRRAFLKRAGVAFAFPAIIPASARGADGYVAPSNRIAMAAIGVGSRGTGNMRTFLSSDVTQMIAVCDVDRGHREASKRLIDEKYGNNDCVLYNDFRELIGRGDLDAVCIAVPDHWHALPAIAAARTGLDIYAEKPFARSIVEGRAMVTAAEAHGCIWQTGSQQRSAGNFRHACELVRNGRLGKITRVEVGLPAGKPEWPYKPIPVPDGLDWEFWLGPAPWRPCLDLGRGSPHNDWRWVLDFSGGALTDWAGHHIDIAHWGLGFDRTGPIEIAGTGKYYTDGAYDVPYAYDFDCLYENGVVINVSSSNQGGTKWYGDKGWVWVNRGKLDASDPKLLKEVIGPDEIKLYGSANHHQNFLDSVRSRKPTVCPAETGFRSISAGLLGEIAMLTGRKLHWNPKTETIQDDPHASALLGRSYREPWTL